MTQKDIKKYTLIKNIVTSAPENPGIAAWFSELLVIDFGVALEVWEFMLATFSREIADMNTAVNLEVKIFEMFVNASETKTRQLVLASDPLVRLVYGACATSGFGVNATFLAGLILSNKLDAAAAVLAAVRSNPTGDFGERMREIVERVFAMYCESKGVVKCELSRKQSALLLEYIGKIRGPNRMLLTQRVKEL